MMSQQAARARRGRRWQEPGRRPAPAGVLGRYRLARPRAVRGHQREHRPAEPAPHHPRAQPSGPLGRLGRDVGLGPGDLEVIPERGVRGVQQGTQPGQVNLDDSNLEEINLAGSAEVRSALQNKAATSVDDLGATRSKLVVIGAAPVLDAHSQVVGAVVVGRIINTSFLKGLALPGAVPVTVIGSHGELLGSTLPGADDIVRSLGGRIVASVVQQGTILQAEATAAKTPYYVAVAPIAPEGHRRLGAVMVSQPQTLADTQRNISQTLFLGALAATLFAVGAAAVSGSRITRPIRELTSAAGRVRQGDLSARVPVTEADEVGALSEAFNQMTTSLDTQAADLREAALQESRLRGELETILQSMTDGLIAVDREGRIVTINREAERISGCTWVEGSVPGHLQVYSSAACNKNAWGAVSDPLTKRALDVDTSGPAFSGQVSIAPKFFYGGTAYTQLLIVGAGVVSPGTQLYVYDSSTSPPTQKGPLGPGSGVVLTLGPQSVMVALNEITGLVTLP